MLAIVVSAGSVGLRSRFDGMAALVHEGVLGHVLEMVRMACCILGVLKIPICCALASTARSSDMLVSAEYRDTVRLTREKIEYSNIIRDGGEPQPAKSISLVTETLKL